MGACLAGAAEQRRAPADIRARGIRLPWWRDPAGICRAVHLDRYWIRPPGRPFGAARSVGA